MSERVRFCSIENSISVPLRIIGGKFVDIAYICSHACYCLAQSENQCEEKMNKRLKRGIHGDKLIVAFKIRFDIERQKAAEFLYSLTLSLR